MKCLENNKQIGEKSALAGFNGFRAHIPTKNGLAGFGGRKNGLAGFGGIALLLIFAAGCTSTSADNAAVSPDVQDEPTLDHQGQIEPMPLGSTLPTADEVNAPACLPTTSVSVELNEVSDLGFAPADVASHAVGTHETTLDWANAESGSAEIVVTLLSQEADVIHFEAASTGEGPAIEIGCPAHMEIPVEIEINSQDGQFNASWMATMTANTADDAAVSIELNKEPFEPILAQLGAERFDEVSVRLDVGFSGDGIDGEISGLGTSSSNPTNDDNSTVSAERFNIASF